jgi:AraC-like DNA-binding protein
VAVTVKAPLGPQRLHGIEAELRTLPGARAVRIADPRRSAIPDHSHDWPILSLYLVGTHSKVHELGEDRLSGPAAVLHAAGARHANVIGDVGVEQIDIEFDPAWLGRKGIAARIEHVRCWNEGPVARAARALAAEWWRRDRAEVELRSATAAFLRLALGAVPVRRPAWVAQVSRALADESPPSTIDLARRLGLHPGWLAQAYCAATGEGVQETVRRHRVERALALVCEAGESQAQVAIAAGFCDQSHMIRSFRRVLGRTPAQLHEAA